MQSWLLIDSSLWDSAKEMFMSEELENPVNHMFWIGDNSTRLHRGENIGARLRLALPLRLTCLRFLAPSGALLSDELWSFGH